MFVKPFVIIIVIVEYKIKAIINYHKKRINNSFCPFLFILLPYFITFSMENRRMRTPNQNKFCHLLSITRNKKLFIYVL